MPMKSRESAKALWRPSAMRDISFDDLTERGDVTIGARSSLIWHGASSPHEHTLKERWAGR